MTAWISRAGGSRRRPEEHRRELARQLTTASAGRGRSAPSGAPRPARARSHARQAHPGGRHMLLQDPQRRSSSVVVGVAAAARPLLAAQQAGRAAARAVGGPGQAVPLHPPRVRRPHLLPRLPGRPDGRLQLRQRPAARSGSGCDNYTNLLRSSGFQDTLFNTLLWMIVVPVVTVAIGLAIAVLADRLKPRCGEHLEDDHLPADGHQRRRRRHRVGLHLRLPPRGPASRSACRTPSSPASASTRSRGCRQRRSTSTASC